MIPPSNLHMEAVWATPEQLVWTITLPETYAYIYSYIHTKRNNLFAKHHQTQPQSLYYYSAIVFHTQSEAKQISLGVEKRKVYWAW